VSLKPSTAASILKPERGADETFEQYRARRRLGNSAVKRYLRGYGEFTFAINPKTGKREPYVKPKETTDEGLAPEGNE
jgi:hypothetical protein